MNERKYESTFIPCGDAMEKMELFAENAPQTTADDGNACEAEDDTAKSTD